MNPIRASKSTERVLPVDEAPRHYPEQAQRAVISNTSVIGAIMVHRGEADAMICGTIGDYHEHHRVVQPLFGFRDGVSTAGAMNALLLPSETPLSPIPMSTTIHRRKSWRRSPDGGGKACVVLVSNRVSRCCRTLTSVQLIAVCQQNAQNAGIGESERAGSDD